MPTATRIRKLGKTVGWTVLFSHPESETLSASNVGLPAMLAGVTGPRVAPILLTVPKQTWHVVCTSGGHSGVKAKVWFYPPLPVLLPR